MEWLHVISPALPESKIREHCTLLNLPHLCSDVYEVTVSDSNDRLAEINCVWGVFQTEAYPIKNGVRYALTTCPNSFQWTITTRHGETTLHGTINQATIDSDFADSIQDFMMHFYQSLQQL